MKTYEFNKFEKTFMALLEETIKVAEKSGKKFTYMWEVDRLYCGNVIGGYYPLERALDTLKNNYTNYAGSNVDNKILEKFNNLYGYARENSKYSLFKAGPEHPTYNPSFAPTIYVVNKLFNKNTNCFKYEEE